jgi:glycosyltransferase involved in cell wall biosynthesis
MQVGLIARADSRGLGIQTKAFHDAIRPAKTMVVDCPSANPLPLRQDWYPGATWIHGLPTADDFQSWLQDLDVVYTAETGYGQALWDEAERQGVRTVLHLNYEFLDVTDRPTVWAAPSMWHYDDIPFANKCFLPVPIELHPADFPTAGRRFLHVVGRPAIYDRNGTEDLLHALQCVQSEIDVTFTCQDPSYVSSLLARYSIPANVTVHQLSGDVTDRWDLYRGQDVLVMPRRFGGLCLPVNEALGAGLPVVMPDISPNNTWLPSGWLVPARHKASFRAKQHIEVFETDCEALAATIDQLAGDDGFYMNSAQKARELAQSLSWDELKSTYEKVLGET